MAGFCILVELVVGVLGSFWQFLVVLGCPLRFLVAIDGFLRFSMLLGGSWYFLVFFVYHLWF